MISASGRFSQLYFVWFGTTERFIIVANMADFEPYSFEPMRDLSDSHGENTAEGQNELARKGNTYWCHCKHRENWGNQ